MPIHLYHNLIHTQYVPSNIFRSILKEESGPVVRGTDGHPRQENFLQGLLTKRILYASLQVIVVLCEIHAENSVGQVLVPKGSRCASRPGRRRALEERYHGASGGLCHRRWIQPWCQREEATRQAVGAPRTLQIETSPQVLQEGLRPKEDERQNHDRQQRWVS